MVGGIPSYPLIHPKLFPALLAEKGIWRAIMGAFRAQDMGSGVTVMNDQISNVRNPSQGIGEDEYAITPGQGVNQQEQRAEQAQPPKSGRNHHLLAPLGRVPLHHESGSENGVAQPANNFPKIPVKFQAEVSPPRYGLSASSFSTFPASPCRALSSRTIPFLSTSHIVGMLLIPNWRPS